MDLHTLADTTARIAQAAMMLRTPLAAIAVLTFIGCALDVRARRQAGAR